MTISTSPNFLPLAYSSEPFDTDKISNFEGLTEKQIIEYAEELIRENNPSTLLLLIDIPENKFTWLHEVRDIEKARCREEDILEFLNRVSPFKLNFLIEVLKIKESLEIPLLKAANSEALLTEKCYLNLICIPPMHLLIAIKSGMNLVALTRFLSPSQLKFLARHAPEEFVYEAIGYLITREHAIKLYSILCSLPKESSHAYSFKKYAQKLNDEFSDVKRRLEDRFSELKEIDRQLQERKIKAKVGDDISKWMFITENENKALNKLNAEIIKPDSLTFEACIAAFKDDQELIPPDLGAIIILQKSIKKLLGQTMS